MYTGKVKEDDLEKIDLFETSEERKIYGKLPDLTKQVPLYLLGLEKEKKMFKKFKEEKDEKEDPSLKILFLY